MNLTIEQWSDDTVQRVWLAAATQLPLKRRDALTGLLADLPWSPEPDSPFDIIGRYRAMVVVHLADRAIAQACVPEDCMVEPPPGVPTGRHPIMYSLGTHRGVHPRNFTVYSYSYDETIVGIPNVFVPHADGRKSGPWFIMTAVRLNEPFANAIGVAMGLPKVLTDFRITNSTYTIIDKADHHPILSTDMQVSGPQFDDTFPHFATVSPLMVQPVLSTSPMGLRLKTPFFINTRTARMFPMTAQLDVFDNSLPGLPSGHYVFGGIDSTPFDGAYLSEHDWRMSPPRITAA